MEEGSASEAIPDLKDIEIKIGRKTPEGLLRWMREDASSLRIDANKMSTAHDTPKETGKKSLDEKIRKLKMEMVRVARACVHVFVRLYVCGLASVHARAWHLELLDVIDSCFPGCDIHSSHSLQY